MGAFVSTRRAFTQRVARFGARKAAHALVVGAGFALENASSR